jgi:hypothetical protein
MRLRSLGFVADAVDDPVLGVEQHQAAEQFGHHEVLTEQCE